MCLAELKCAPCLGRKCFRTLTNACPKNAYINRSSIDEQISRPVLVQGVMAGCLDIPRFHKINPTGISISTLSRLGSMLLF